LGNTSPASQAFPIRAVQLDLARQMETVDYVCRYADFAASVGFNTLMLYLEARIRTDSFPFRPVNETYTLGEMETIVQHAASVGVEVVPGLSTLGHVEQFLACPEMAHLAEEREGRARFGNPQGFVFCTSLPETYSFLEAYIAEVTQVFPSEHIHIGCDEVWNLGYCSLCQEQWKRNGLGSVFAQHIQKMDEICSALGKRIWIWDDMYEFFPEELELAPRKMVMCHWQYDRVIESEGIKAHFANRWRQDWLGVYEKMGFDALLCPRETTPGNIRTFTHYARRHPVLGGLLTQWEMSASFPDQWKPTVAYCGKLWSQPELSSDQAWGEALDTGVPDASDALKVAVRSLQDLPTAYLSPSPLSHLRGPLSYSEGVQQTAHRASLQLLRTARSAERPSANELILNDIETSARLTALHFTLRELLPAIYDPRRRAVDVPHLRDKAAFCQRELDDLISVFAPQHEKRRPGMHPEDGGTKHLQSVKAGLEEGWARLDHEPTDEDRWLLLRLFLPDVYGAPRLKVIARFGDEERTLADGSFKPPISAQECYYTLQVPFTSASAPTAAVVEAWGYGGQGITFLEFQNPNTTVVPAEITHVSGPVKEAENILRDDSSWTYLGRVDVHEAMHDPSLAETRGRVVVSLLPAAEKAR